MAPIVIVQKYDMQAVAMQREDAPTRPSFLLLFSASKVFGLGVEPAQPFHAELSSSLAQIGEHAVGFANGHGSANHYDTQLLKDVTRCLRQQSGALWSFFDSALKNSVAKKVAEGWAFASSAGAGVPCIACVIDQPSGQPIPRIGWPANMTGEGAYGFGFFEPEKQIVIDALPLLSRRELVGSDKFIVTGKL
jgi:hypothetical protein